MLLDDQTPDNGTDEQELETPTPVEETTENPSEETKVEETQVTEQPSPEPQAPEGYIPKEKFVASARESILNAERAKIAQAQIEQLTKTDTPTDEAMRQLYTNWDELDQASKNFYIKQEVQDMKQKKIELQQQEIINRQKLEDELETAIESNPKLQAKASEFKRFAKNPKNKGISMEVLTKAFLFDVETPVAPAPRGEALPSGNGGPRGDLKPKKISMDEAIEIRKTDYKKYKELLDSNMIEEIE